MKVSRLFLPTLREAPADAELAGHRLLVRGGFVRGGFVRRVAAGVYSYLPLGWRVLRKIERIVREEMDAIGDQELLLPALLPAELLAETGRGAVDVLFGLKDRGGREMLLGFTHEEAVTDIVRSHVHSWKQLPLTLYQIQTKFRDEPRPRGGLIRAREFTMKDAYSFDYDPDGMARSYEAHHAAYLRIFERCGLECLSVEADSGDIGGSENLEFMAIAECGEDTVLQCGACGYAANAERAAIPAPEPVAAAPGEPASQVVDTPGAHTVAQVCAMLGVGPERLIKTVIVTADGTPAAALVRGDRQLNLAKLRGVLAVSQVAMADDATVERVTGAPVGFAGPVGLQRVRIVADHELRGARGMVVGANAADAHRTGVAPEVDFAVDAWADVRVATAGDSCPRPGCSGTYREVQGIELGHIFQLGTRYSHAMGAQVQMETGENRDIYMGCYGIGVSRIMAAIVELHHDERGILWPAGVAPYEAVVLAVNPRDDAQRDVAERIYAELLETGVEALYDDREERSGVKFADADLVGCPVRIVAGRAVGEGMVEVAPRADRSAARLAPITEAADTVRDMLEKAAPRA